jgi:hypothetical protein
VDIKHAYGVSSLQRVYHLTKMIRLSVEDDG